MSRNNIEDKKCRICGLADTKNVNIFACNNKTLLTKILTVYPTVLYKNDPLPKNICKKCSYNVSFMYNDIQRVIKTQQKWISNVRSIQPTHDYIRINDLITHSNSVTKDTIRATFGEELNELSINRLLLLPAIDSATPTTTVAHKLLPVSNVPKKIKNSPKIKDIKSKLELNGCSLLAVKTSPIRTSTQNIPDITKVETADEGEFLMFEKTRTKVNRRTPPPVTTKCRYCPLQFQTLAALAAHQLVHLRLSTPKIFQKKYLQKSLRRGRLITVQQRKCIRCLNCWRIFANNKSILEHWSHGECEFYCQICGAEYVESPKMLREHVTAVHGINYRSAKMQSEATGAYAVTSADYKLYQTISEQEPLPSEEDGVLIKANNSTRPQAPTTPTATNTKTATASLACRICKKVFKNFRSRNSHMRIHKPLNALSRGVNNSDEYATVGSQKEEQETNKSFFNNKKTIAVVSTHPIVSTATFNNSNTNTNTKIHGVRTKYVQRRKDTRNEQTEEKPVIKVKSISDLRAPANAVMMSPTNHNDKPKIKTEPMDVIAPPVSNTDVVFSCVSCGICFATKLDLLRHKRVCASNCSSVCKLCDEIFAHREDYQIHMALMH